MSNDPPGATRAETDECRDATDAEVDAALEKVAKELERIRKDLTEREAIIAALTLIEREARKRRAARKAES